VPQIEGIHNADTLLTYRAPDYLSTDTANELAVTFVATQEMADNDGWMLISMPLAVNGEVNLGAVTMKEKNSDNHFLNGDFSDGLTGWMVNNDSSYISVQDSVLNVSDKVPTGDVKLYQAMYLEKGIYRLSFDVLGAPTSWRPVYFIGTALDNSSVTGSQLQVSQESGKTEGAWWTVTREVTIETAGTYYFQMNLNQESGGASVAPIMQYDNFELRQLETVIITWKNDDGTVLEEDMVVVGTVPEYNGDLPAKEADAHNSYKFIGWDKEIVAVTAEATYTAQWVDDINNNDVEDTTEIITIKVIKADEKDAITVDNAVVKPLSTADGVATYIYNSKNPTITITATPAVDGALSKTYVQSVKVGEEAAALTYGDKFVATATIEAENGDVITVAFAEAELDLYENRVMNYYAGMKNVAQKDLYETLAAAPAYDDADEITITYKAREAKQMEVSLDVIKSVIDEKYGYLIDLLKKLEIEGILENGKIQFKMHEIWLPVDVENKEPFPESVSLDTAVENFLKKDIKNFGELLLNILGDILSGKTDSIGASLEEFFAPVYDAAMYYEAHRFGYNTTGAELLTEEIKVTYKSKAVYLEESTTVELRDQRAVSTISGNNVTVIYRDYTDAELLAAIGAQVNEVPGAEVTCDQINATQSFEGAAVSENAYQLKFKFAGNEEYRPAEAVFTVTVTKASLSMDVTDAIVSYGEGYNQDPTYTKGNKYGVDAEINESLIRFIVGLDVAELDVNQDGVHGLKGKIQVILNKEIQDLLNSALDRLGKDYRDGMEMSLSDLTEYLSLLGDTSVDSLNQILESIAGVTELGDLTITLGGSYPTDTGAYLHGAVSTNANYETAYDVGYIVIKPNATELPLTWNEPALTNAIVTLPLFQGMDKGATAEGAKDMEVGYVILGINSDTSELLTTDIYGNIKLNIWVDPGEIKDNGAYLQVAYGIEWGNEMEYAIPIVRSFAIVPAMYKVELVDANGTVDNELLKTFNNQPQGFGIIVRDNNGNILYSD
jgi:hypothetical protein